MSQPLVSLMMISYNNVAYLKAAIDSIRAQTYTNWEMVISDDCSTDGSWELAQVLGARDPRIKVVQTERNLKTPGNRAFAAKHLTGDLVGHIDADDTLFPYSVQTVVDYLDANPDIAMVYSDMAEINAAGVVTGYTVNKGPDPKPNLAFHGWRPFGVYRRSAYRTVSGYNDKLTQGCEDGDLFLQIAEEHKFAKIPQVLYSRRSHGANNSPKNHKCETCPDRPVCNYVRIWSKHAGYDPVTFTPLKKD